MKPFMPAALLIALSTVALAKPTPIELPTALVDAAIMNLGSGGSMQENPSCSIRCEWRSHAASET